MSIEGFRPVSWNPNEVIGDTKMDRMTTNDQILFESMPIVSYRGFGVTRDESIKIAAGIVTIGASKQSYATEEVRFGSFFSANCNPIVTTGTVSEAIRRVHITIKGIGTIHPDRRGFMVNASMDQYNRTKNNIPKAFYVSYMAMGY